MGYIAYLDALGFKSYYASGAAKQHLTRLHGYAQDAFASPLPGQTKRVQDDPSSTIVLLNDSVFMYSEFIENAVWFSSCLARLAFFGGGKSTPIGMRGGIAETNKIPIIIETNKVSDRFTGKTIIVDQIAAAMAIDKSRILGPRIIIPKSLVDANYKNWDVRLQSKIMNVEKAYKGKGVGILKHDSEKYYDLSYMVNKTEDGPIMIERAKVFWQNACHSERSSLHASAAMALIEASVNKHSGASRAIILIAKGLARSGQYNGGVTEKSTYAEVMQDYKKIEKIYGKKIQIDP